MPGVPGKRAEGTPLRLSGRVLDTQGAPVKDALVEIWQCDNRAVYRHPKAPRQGQGDPNFPGYGESRAGADGVYQFLTIVPVAYPGRPPHIHVKVKALGRDELTTQLYILGHPENDRDGLLSRVLFGGKDQLMMGLSEWRQGDSQTGQQAQFDFVL